MSQSTTPARGLHARDSTIIPPAIKNPDTLVRAQAHLIAFARDILNEFPEDVPRNPRPSKERIGRIFVKTPRGTEELTIGESGPEWPQKATAHPGIRAHLARALAEWSAACLGALPWPNERWTEDAIRRFRSDAWLLRLNLAEQDMSTCEERSAFYRAVALGQGWADRDEESRVSNKIGKRSVSTYVDGLHIQAYGDEEDSSEEWEIRVLTVDALEWARAVACHPGGAETTPQLYAEEMLATVDSEVWRAVDAER